jgi:hypothetical protein
MSDTTGGATVARGGSAKEEGTPEEPAARGAKNKTETKVEVPKAKPGGGAGNPIHPASIKFALCGEECYQKVSLMRDLL